MAHIYYDKQEIEIPHGAYINHSDGRVFIFIKEEGVPLEKSKRRVIGKRASDKTMYPNDTFRNLYPNLWEEKYGKKERLPKREVRSGLYALCLGAGNQTGVYYLLNEVYGPLYANAIMDFSMYSMLTKSDVAQTLQERMSDEVTFSRNELNDTFLSDMFSHKMTREQGLEFRKQWIEHCKDEGVTSAWISIDGSNNGCAAVQCNLAEPGKAKSHTNSHIVSYMYAVNALTGIPVTYTLYNGGKIDAKAFMELYAFLELYDIKCEGVLLDRGFCTGDVISTLEEAGIPYVIMLKGDTLAHKSMYEAYADEVRWNVKHVINENSLFGISTEEKCKIFSNSDLQAYLNFYHDGMNGSERSVSLVRNIMCEIERVSHRLEEGKDAGIKDSLARYLSIVDDNGVRRIACDHDRWQSDLDAKGFYTIASSMNVGAQMTYELYTLRDASETQYMFSKSQLGFDVTRVHSTESIESKFLVCFVSSILRSRIQNICKAMHVQTNKMLLEIDRLKLCLIEGDVYLAVHDETRRQKELLAGVGVGTDNLEYVAEEYNMRKKNACSQYRRLSESTPEKKTTAEKVQQEKRPVGRPKGSKSKKTKTSKAVDNSSIQQEKRKPGRPKGSKNKKADQDKPRRGRPKGSKNKKTLEREAEAKLHKRKPGRPKGSKNKRKSGGQTTT